MGKEAEGRGWWVMVVLVCLAGSLSAQESGPTARDRAAFRTSLTATVLRAGPAADSAGPGCRVVSLEWRALPGAAAYQVQVSLGQPGLWIAVSPDPRCPGDGAAGPTAYHDRVPRPSTPRSYRVVATASDGRGVEVTAPVPVETR